MQKNRISKFKIKGPFQKFVKVAVNGSYLLFAATLMALIWANVAPEGYHHFWHTKVTLRLGDVMISKSVAHWIDEALMTIFFFIVGLEIKREILVGELASLKRALMPVSAAIGGMFIPALIYTALNYGTPFQKGWGIPMATDIAFSLALLSAFGNRVPFGVKVFLSAFAIADDLGAVVVIAAFYTETIFLNYIAVACLFLILLMAANYLNIRWPIVYAVLGLGMWGAVLGSGVHATIAGVIVAAFIPARAKYDTDTFVMRVRNYLGNFECEDTCGLTILTNKKHLNTVQDIELACHEVETPLQRLDHALTPYVSYLILPLFALANAGVVFNNLDIGASLSYSMVQGILLGLFVGKPVGIVLFTYLSVKLFKTDLHAGTNWHHIIGAGFMGGVGFTMSLFISGLSFPDPAVLETAKLGIIGGSVISGCVGCVVFGMGRRTNTGSPET